MTLADREGLAPSLAPAPVDCLPDCWLAPCWSGTGRESHPSTSEARCLPGSERISPNPELILSVPDGRSSAPIRGCHSGFRLQQALDEGLGLPGVRTAHARNGDHPLLVDHDDRGRTFRFDDLDARKRHVLDAAGPSDAAVPAAHLDAIGEDGESSRTDYVQGAELRHPRRHLASRPAAVEGPQPGRQYASPKRRSMVCSPKACDSSQRKRIVPIPRRVSGRRIDVGATGLADQSRRSSSRGRARTRPPVPTGPGCRATGGRRSRRGWPGRR